MPSFHPNGHGRVTIHHRRSSHKSADQDVSKRGCFRYFFGLLFASRRLPELGREALDGEDRVRGARPLGVRARRRSHHAVLSTLSGGAHRDRAGLAHGARDHLPRSRLPRAGRRRARGHRVGVGARGRRRDQPGGVPREHRDLRRGTRPREPRLHRVEPAAEPRGDGEGGAAARAARDAAHAGRAAGRASTSRSTPTRSSAAPTPCTTCSA